MRHLGHISSPRGYKGQPPVHPDCAYCMYFVKLDCDGKVSRLVIWEGLDNLGRLNKHKLSPTKSKIMYNPSHSAIYTKIQICCYVHSLCINPPNIFAIMSADGYTTGSSLPNMPNTHDAVLATSNFYSC